MNMAIYGILEANKALYRSEGKRDRNMKRLLAVLLSAVLMLGMLTGCGDTTPSYEPKAVLEFPKLNWGLSVEEVRAVYPCVEEQESEFAGSVTYSGEVELYGQPAVVTFHFYDTENGTFLAGAKARWEGLSYAQYEAIDEQVKPVFAKLEAMQQPPKTSDYTGEQQALYEKNVRYTGQKEYPMAMSQFITQYGIGSFYGDDGAVKSQWYEMMIAANFWVMGNIQIFPEGYTG